MAGKLFMDNEFLFLNSSASDEGNELMTGSGARQF
jgi:hypothetical protein